MLEAAEAADASVSGWGAAPSGRLAVAAWVAFGRLKIVLLPPRFLERYLTRRQTSCCPTASST